MQRLTTSKLNLRAGPRRCILVSALRAVSVSDSTAWSQDGTASIEGANRAQWSQPEACLTWTTQDLGWQKLVWLGFLKLLERLTEACLRHASKGEGPSCLVLIEKFERLMARVSRTGCKEDSQPAVCGRAYSQAAGPSFALAVQTMKVVSLQASRITVSPLRVC